MVAEAAEHGSVASSRKRRRPGFALFAAVIIIAVIAVISTVVAVTLSGDNDQDRVERAADVLARLVAAIDTTRTASIGTSFAGVVRKYPSRLSQLYTKIGSGDLECRAASALTFGTTPAGNWLGPYYYAPIGTAGYLVAPGFFASDLLHGGMNGTTVDTLAIELTNVSLSDAQLLQLFVDRNGLSNGLGKAVKYSPRDGSSPVTVEYVIFAGAANGLSAGCT
jgi:type II secretory pathway pseudopilin PulG